MSDRTSYKQILRSSSVIGGASILNVAIGLVRTKAAALLLGPAGVGLIGLLQSMMTTASSIAGLGLSNVGTRQIAEAAATGDLHAVGTTRRALLWATVGLASFGAIVFWMLRGVLAAHVLRDSARAAEVAWLALGVALTVASASQGALLNGMRRIGDLARISVGSALLSTAAAISAVWLCGARGILAFVLAAPAASFLLGHWYVAKMGRLHSPPASLAALAANWWVMVRLGAAFMVSGLAVSLGQLLSRALIQRELGPVALGHFQAAWLISMTYLGFVLSAMGTDFYPRLTAVIRHPDTVNQLVNEQTEVALLLAGPAFLALLALAPWIVDLLYSSAFADAAEILRWQVLGDVLKVASWPLGFIILAAGDGRIYMMTEVLAIGVFVLLVYVLLPGLGIVSTGVAFLIMYVLYLPIVYFFAGRRTAFRWSSPVRHLLMALFGTAVAVAALGGLWKAAGTVVGTLAACGFGLHGLARLGHMVNLGGAVGRLSALSRRAMMKVGVWRE
jgi:O-antigen/teichoic acid export membrane protein